MEKPKQICVYSVSGIDGVIENKVETFGMLYYADISKFEELPNFEMEKIELFDSLPENRTYPVSIDVNVITNDSGIIVYNGKVILLGDTQTFNVLLYVKDENGTWIKNDELKNILNK